MLLHDSLSVEEGVKMISLAKKDYWPDFTFGLQYITMPDNPGYRGWTVSAGITLPFAPWSLGRTNAKVEEAEIGVEKARAALNNTRNMIRSNISDLYFKAESFRQQWENYTAVIVPQTGQALQASMMAYQTGRTDFLMLIDSYRMLVEVTMEKLMLRMKFEQAVAELKREVGYAGIFEKRD
jgi:outer membrane protein TolC